VHEFLSSSILKTENLEINPRNVPTGQTVLQYKRPLKAENKMIINKKNNETASTVQCTGFKST